MKRTAFTVLSVITFNLGLASAAIPVFTPAQLLDLPAHYQNYSPVDSGDLTDRGGFVRSYASWFENNESQAIVHVEDGHPNVWQLILDGNVYPIDTLAPDREVIVKLDRPYDHGTEIDLIKSGLFAGTYVERVDLGGGYYENTFVTKEFALKSFAAENADDDHSIFSFSSESPLYYYGIAAFLLKHDEFCNLQYVTCVPRK